MTPIEELKVRCEKIRYYFLGKGFQSVTEYLDYGREIGFRVKADRDFAARYPTSLSDDDIIADMEKILGGETTEYAQTKDNGVLVAS